jgi:hypothetical protein
MRITISIFLLLLIAGSIQADSYSDSLRKELKLVKSPEQKLDILHLLIRKHWTSNPDKTENYLSEAIKIAEKTEILILWEGLTLLRLSFMRISENLTRR